MSNIENAAKSVAREMELFAATIAPEWREDFFHSTNRDMWVRDFCEWLAAKQRRSAEVRASND